MWSQCTFWCSVLSDSPTVLTVGGQTTSLNAPSGAQCFPTVERSPAPAVWGRGLNAPSGAQCFPTSGRATVRLPHTVSMHLLVLSAFRLGGVERRVALSQGSQCTFWCSVLSDQNQLGGVRRARRIRVSMHLLVLSAFRPETSPSSSISFSSGLNAPSGAQCFPTRMRGLPWRLRLLGLNAPSGAQCFPTGRLLRLHRRVLVSMHLLVLSAFRPQSRHFDSRTRRPSQCTFWCSVLSDRKADILIPGPAVRLNAPSGAQCFPTAFLGIVPQARAWSQCTFWCSVLSDG